MSLVEKYRPRRLADLLGQPWATYQLQAFAEAPYPCAFLFAGDTGTGKTSAALALAADLGLSVEEGEFGGLYQIASGEQTGESVRRVMAALHHNPFFGSGWKVLVVNEADCMTPNAAHVWLDALEDLPPRSVVVFTTNAAARLPARLRDRCEVLQFESSAMLLRPYLQELAGQVWRQELGRDDCPDVDDFGSLADEAGNASFRRLLQNMTPHVRRGQLPDKTQKALPPAARPAVDRSAAARKAWATRLARKKEMVNG